MRVVSVARRQIAKRRFALDLDVVFEVVYFEARFRSVDDFPDNDRGIKAVSFDFNSTSPALIVRTATGETRMTIGRDTWTNSRGIFANGLDHALSVPANPLVAATGAWSSEDTFTVKLVLSETPYYSTLIFKFDGDRLLFDSEHNVNFGPTKLPQLIGVARATE